MIFVPVFLVLPEGFQLRRGDAFFIGLFPDFALAPDLEVEPIGERVDDRNADAVQSARNFIGLAVEFSAGVQHRHHDFGGGLLFRGVHVNGNAAAVVDYGDAVIVVDVTLISSQNPAMASSTELSTTSQTRWCKPNSPVEPIYIAGRLRTASSAAENFDRSRVVLVPDCRALFGRGFFVAHEWCVSSEL